MLPLPIFGMMDPLPDLDVEIPEVTQVGLVVENLEDAVERFESLLGLEPWSAYRLEPPELTDTTYHGESVEFGMRIAHSYAGETDVELIEPTLGPNIYTDHLEEHGEGLHHIKSTWDGDEDKTYGVVEEFQDAGVPVLQSGSYKGSEFWYFDTADLLNGLIFETSIRRNMDERTPEFVHPE